MKSTDNLKHDSINGRSVLFSRAHNKICLFVLSYGIIGFVLPMCYGFIKGFPVPQVHDEFSYLLAADTYASGRLTNPSPAFPENFESPHILVEPSYMSKYPPMQGIFLAVGQIIFGNPAYGLWLSCGAAAAAFFWMMLAWTRLRWAVVGTTLMILFIGINSYWAQSYWGGMVAAMGSALFLGGFRRLFQQMSVGSAIWMTLGGAILVNSRPFEGTLTMGPALLVLFIWLLRDKSNTFLKKFYRIILPGATITIITLIAMSYYNFRVTGNAFTLPYTAHQRQYYPSPLFIFQPVGTAATRGHQRLRKLYNNWTTPLTYSMLPTSEPPDIVYLRPLYAFILLLLIIPYFLMLPPLVVLLYLTTPLLMRRNRWLALIGATILFTFAIMSVGTWWDVYHYSASLTCCFFLLLAEGFQLFFASSKKGFQQYLSTGLLTLLVILSFVSLQFFSSKLLLMPNDNTSNKSLLFERLSLNEPVQVPIHNRATFFKPEFEDAINKLPDKYIALVAYDKNYNVYDEIVYNKADIPNSKLIWAHDLGEEKDKAFLNYYKDRKVVFMKISNSGIEIIPSATN